MKERTYTVQEDAMLRRGTGRREQRIIEERMITKLIPNGPPQTLYDIGVGCYYEFRTLKIIYPDMAVFGCEPSPREHAELLPIFPGELRNCALGREEGRRIFQEAPVGSGGSSFYRKESSIFTPVEVPVITLDRFDALCGRPYCILLWLDVEDSELDVLESGRQLLASGRVEWMNIETRHENEPGHPTTVKVTELLDQFGYHPVFRYNVNGAYPMAAGDTVYFKKGVESLIPAVKGMPLS